MTGSVLAINKTITDMAPSNLLFKKSNSPDIGLSGFNVKHHPFEKSREMFFDYDVPSQFSIRENQHTQSSLGPHLQYFLITVSTGLLIALAMYLVLLVLIIA